VNPEHFNGFRWCQNASDRNALDLSIASHAVEPAIHIIGKQYNVALVPSTSTSFVSISTSNMHFGFGRQACPGRFFAAYTIKAIMSRLIMEYEFKFDDRQAGLRPVNWVVGEHVLPNTSPIVLIKKRTIGL
jgi:cytochrome P450